MPSSPNVYSFLQLVASFRNEFIFVSFFLSIPSIVLYVAQILTIIRHKQFHNPFYSLFVVRAIMDLLYVADSFYGYRMPTLFGTFLLPFYRNLPNWGLALFYFLSNYTFHAENLSTFFLLANRFTAIAFPIKHKKFWHFFSLPAIAFAVVAPFFVCFFVFWMDAIIHVVENEDKTVSFLIMEQQNGTFVKSVNYSRAVLSLLFLLSSSLLNLLTFVAYRRHRNNSSPQNSSNLASIERKLFIYAIYTFAGHVLSSFLMILLFLYATDQQVLSVMYSQYPWVMDLATLVLSSWLLLWASDSFRHQLVGDLSKLFRCFYRKPSARTTEIKLDRKGTVKVTDTRKTKKITDSSNSWDSAMTKHLAHQQFHDLSLTI